jgi:mannose-6-phosphate isomerase-like protein (cupin superfamily)
MMQNMETFSALGVTTVIRATAEETGGAFSLIEMTIPAGFPGAPPHRHGKMSESFYVLEGTLTVTRATAEVDITAGNFVYIAPGTRHAFRNTSSNDVRFLLMATPGGHEQFFRELYAWMSVEPQWPPHDRQKLVEFGLKHDTVYG